jgi:hypothetical protein
LQLNEGAKIGFDPSLMSAGSHSRISANLKVKGITLHPIQENLIDLVWSDKSQEIINEVFVHGEKWVD